MKKISETTKEQLTILLRDKCADYELSEFERDEIAREFEQLARNNQTTIEVFESEEGDNANSIYDFIIENGGEALIDELIDAVNSKTHKATPVFVTPESYSKGSPFMVIVHAKTA